MTATMTNNNKFKSEKFEQKSLRSMSSEEQDANPELCLKLALAQPYELQYMIKQTPEFCSIVVQRFNSSIGQVHSSKIAMQIYLDHIIDKDISLISYIKEYNLEFYKEAIQRDYKCFKYIRKHHKTEEVCLFAVKINPYCLGYAPIGKISKEMQFDALRRNGYCLRYIQENRKTFEICLEAVKSVGAALAYVNEEYKTPELCITAVQNDGLALEYIDYEKKTLDICFSAVEQNPLALDFVPPKLQMENPEIAFLAVKKNGKALAHCIEKDREICEIAIRNYPSAIRFMRIQQDLFPDLCMEAVKLDGSVINFIVNQTPELCIEALKSSGGEVLHYVKDLPRTLIHLAHSLDLSLLDD